MLRDNKVFWGIETERFTGVKSDSRWPMREGFPYPLKDIDVAYITHWDPFCNLYRMKDKYFQPASLEGIPIRTLSYELSHHDSHAHAALRFAQGMPMADTILLVIDGFGTHGEHLSVYQVVDNRRLRLLKRRFGYDTSLGLMYQYATAFMGMKMHEDEYKLLGYEAHVDEIKIKDPAAVDRLVKDTAYAWLNRVQNLKNPYDPVLNLDALENVRAMYFKFFSEILEVAGFSDPTKYESRVILAYAVQSLLEKCVHDTLAQFRYTNLIVTGGVCYNVKLNKRMMDWTPGTFCAFPLAGDQGNALGLYAHDHYDFEFPDHLTWGIRDFAGRGAVEGIHWVEESRALPLLMENLDRYGYVNLVRGNMEFGPRALCNTTTLALPTKRMVEVINFANQRNTVMPMAPVMSETQYHRFFEDTHKVHKSHKYMIMAMNYRTEELALLVEGAAHKYMVPYLQYTGRPQVVGDDDILMAALLKVYGPLINTSFNYHGKPIAFDTQAIVENHRAQRARNENIQTVVIVE